MKTIQPVSIWDNGTDQNATVLNTYAADVALNSYATFNYFLFSQTEDGNLGPCLRNGTLNMTGEAYQLWQSDDYAWDWVAAQLNLTITGEYIKPFPPEPTTTTTEAPTTTTTTTTTAEAPLENI
jgi:hypothetical protein